MNLNLRLSLLKILIFLIIGGLFFLSSKKINEETAFLIPKKLGGDTSRIEGNNKAFTFPAKNISRTNLRSFFFGNSLFNTSWTTYPGSVKSLDGLGPLFNRSACSACHLRDGRGRPPLPGEEKDLSILYKIAVLKEADSLEIIDHPRYGRQIQPQAINGVNPEAKVKVNWRFKTGTYADGRTYELRYPTYELKNRKYSIKGKDKNDFFITARVAPQVIGLGLLEAILEKDILKLADPNDKNQNGISGRYLRVKNDNSEFKIGRLGWKAEVPNVRMQVAKAAINDMGLTNPLFPDECLENQADCNRANEKIGKYKDKLLDISEIQLKKLTLYSSLLGVPERRNIKDPMVRRGEKLFSRLDCARCHNPSYTTSSAATHLPALRGQKIYPFTDLLLHDLGDELADAPADGYKTTPDGDKVYNREWRTSPLWGIGLFDTVNGHTFYLHDGRARNLEEAILWHGGEAEGSRNKFKGLSKFDREALVDFLNSL